MAFRIAKKVETEYFLRNSEKIEKSFNARLTKDKTQRVDVYSENVMPKKRKLPLLQKAKL